MFGLQGEKFVNLKDEVDAISENTITLVLKEPVELVNQALEEAIAFYNDFLERQERYQQETLEQREAEKAWIDQQRWELEQVQHGIEAILNASWGEVLRSARLAPLVGAKLQVDVELTEKYKGDRLISR